MQWNARRNRGRDEHDQQGEGEVIHDKRGTDSMSIEETIQATADEGFLCNACGERMRVCDSRFNAKYQEVRRRRACGCGSRITTYERKSMDVLTVTDCMNALARGGVRALRMELEDRGLSELKSVKVGRRKRKAVNGNN